MAFFSTTKLVHAKPLAAGVVCGISIVGLLAIFFIVLPFNLSSSEQAVRPLTIDRSDTEDAERRDQSRSNSDIAKTLAQIVNLDTYFAKELALRRVAQEADWQTLLSLLHQSNEISAKRFRNLIQDVVIQGLANINPQEALDGIYDVAPRAPEPDPNLDPRSLATWRHLYLVSGRAEELIRIVYQEWSLFDLEQAVEHAKALGELQVQAAFNGIVDSRDDLSEDELLAIALKLNIESVFHDSIAKAMARESIDDPDSAWQMFFERNKDNLSLSYLSDSQRELLQSIADALLEKHGIDVIYKIDEQLPDEDVARSNVLAQFLRQAIQHDPIDAIKTAVSLKPDRFRTIYSVPMMSWAEIDHFAALDAAYSYEDEELRTDLLRGVHLTSRTWADPQSLIEYLANYPKDLCASTFNRAVTNLAEQTPEVAATYLSEISEHREKLRVGTEIMEQWSQRDVFSALEWVKSDPGLNEARSALLNVVLAELLHVNPRLALQTALEQPLGTNSIGPESSVIRELAQYDLETAVGMLPKARNRPTKLEAAIGIAKLMLEGLNSKGVLDLGKSSTVPDSDKYFEMLFPYWTFRDPNGLHQHIDQLSSVEQKSHAALALIRESQYRRGFSLSEEQMDQIKGYLTDEHSSLLDEVLEEAARTQENFELTRYR